MQLRSSTGQIYFDSEKAAQSIAKHEGTFVKRINYYRRTWKWFERDEDGKTVKGWAYGIQLPVLNWLRTQSNVKAICFKDTDDKSTYTVSLAHFVERCKIEDLNFGEQAFLRTDQFDEVVEGTPKTIKVKKAKQTPLPAPQMAQKPAVRQIAMF